MAGITSPSSGVSNGTWSSWSLARPQLPFDGDRALSWFWLTPIRYVSITRSGPLPRLPTIDEDRVVYGRGFWTEPVEVTKHMQHPGELIPLGDGRLLPGDSEHNRACGAKAILNRDGGKTWGDPVVLADKAPNVDCGSSVSGQLIDGSIATMYYQVDDTIQAPYTTTSRTVVWKAP
jgi:hypothetical protein